LQEKVFIDPVQDAATNLRKITGIRKNAFTEIDWQTQSKP